MRAALLVLATVCAAPAHADDLWAGYQVVEGKKALPVIGELETRTRTWFIARWREDGEGAVMVQRTCGVAFDKVMGVRVQMPRQALRHLPVTTTRFASADAGFVATDAVEGWGREDLDRDGHPGVTIQVDAPMCGGRLHVASTTTTQARARKASGAIEGQVDVAVDQTILGAEDACLRAAAEDSQEQMSGWFRLVKVRPDASCASWSHRDWPARTRR